VWSLSSFKTCVVIETTVGGKILGNVIMITIRKQIKLTWDYLFLASSYKTLQIVSFLPLTILHEFYENNCLIKKRFLHKQDLDRLQRWIFSASEPQIAFVLEHVVWGASALFGGFRCKKWAQKSLLCTHAFRPSGSGVSNLEWTCATLERLSNLSL